MKLSNENIVTYRYQLSDEMFQDALLMYNNRRLRSTVNRLYYSVFYRLLGMLTAEGLKAKTHTGIKTHFHKQFVITKRIDKHFGMVYERLFVARHDGDYDDLVLFEEDEVASLFEDTTRLPAALKELS